MRSPEGSLRLFPQVRSLHIDDLNAASPRPTIFVERYYEAASRELPSDWEQVSKLQAIVRIWRAPPQTLELFEPLWFAYFPLWVAVAVTHRIRTFRSPAQRAFFAIENNDLESIVPRGDRLGGLPATLARLALRILIPLLIDKVAYGTEASEALYSQFTGRAPESKLIPQVRASRLEHAPVKTHGSVAFVGALHERKGLPLLLQAWEAVEDDLPDAKLTLVGDGPLSEQAARWAADRPDRRSFHGQVERADVIEMLTATSVIAVPSQRWGRWREQINGAIQEALSVGCTVVTTSETGLAGWLKARGHTVVEPGVSALELGASLAAAVRSPLDPATVIESLPTSDGRVNADRWLHTIEVGRGHRTAP